MGVVGHLQDLVLEILEVEGELVQLVRASRHRVPADEVVQVVGVRFAAAQVRQRGIGNLIVRRRVLLPGEPVQHVLPVGQALIDLERQQGIVVRRRDRPHRLRPGNRGQLREDRIRADGRLGTRLVEPLERAEEEQLVPPDRPAHRAAVLPSLEGRLGRAAVLEEILRDQAVVPEGAETRAAQVVRPRLADHVDHAADRASAFRAPAVLEHLEFLDPLVGKVLQEAADDVVLVVAPVDVHVELPSIAAVHREVADAGLGGIESARGTRFRHRHRQVRERPVQRRQVGDVARRDDAAQFRTGRLDERRVGGDRHRLGDGADFKPYRKRLARADGDDDVFADRFLEAGELGGHGVAAGRERREDIVPSALVSVLREARFAVHGRDRDAGNDAPAGLPRVR